MRTLFNLLALPCRAPTHPQTPPHPQPPLTAEATAADMAAREAREAAEAHAREAEQRHIREKQIADEKARRAHDKAEKHAYEIYQMKLSAAADEARRAEATAALEEKRAVVREQMVENMRALERKKAAAATWRIEEQRAMEELNAMVEAQARAHSDVSCAVVCVCGAYTTTQALSPTHPNNTAAGGEGGV